MTTSVATLNQQLSALGLHPGALVMVHAGLRAVGPVGGCTAELLPASAFVDFAADWLSRNL